MNMGVMADRAQRSSSPRKSSGSHGAIPRSKSRNYGWSQYHLVTQMWCYSTHWFQRHHHNGQGQTKMAHSLPSWMYHSDQTGCWTCVSPNRKEAISSISAQFYHMAERYERARFGWHCAKLNGHAELKIEKSRVKTSSYYFPKFQPQQFWC